MPATLANTFLFILQGSALADLSYGGRFYGTKLSKTVKKSQKIVRTAKMIIGVLIVTNLPRLYQQCTNRQKQSKDSQNSKNDHWCHWCTNRHMSTQSPPNTQSPFPCLSASIKILSSVESTI